MRIAALVVIALVLAGCGGGTRTVTTTTTVTKTVTQPSTSAAPGAQNATYFGEPVSVSNAGSGKDLLVVKPESYLVGVTANVAFAQQQGKTCAPLSCPGRRRRSPRRAGGKPEPHLRPARGHDGNGPRGCLRIADEDHGHPARGARRRREDAEACRAARLRCLARGRRRQGDVVRAAVRALALPARRALLEKRAQALLALVARAPLGDPARGLGAVRTLAHESASPSAPPAGRPRAARRRRARPPRRDRSATSCTSPMRSAVSASKRSPVTK